MDIQLRWQTNTLCDIWIDEQLTFRGDVFIWRESDTGNHEISWSIKTVSLKPEELAHGHADTVEEAQEKIKARAEEIHIHGILSFKEFVEKYLDYTEGKSDVEPSIDNVSLKEQFKAYTWKESIETCRRLYKEGKICLDT